jgi:N-methylhydantoinase B
MSLALGMISGRDQRKEGPYYGELYINELFVGNNGGPATRDVDGWLTYGGATDSGLLYRDSIEVLEQKYPVRIEWVRLVPDSGGAGRRRGALTVSAGFRSVDGPITVAWFTGGRSSRGVKGGLPGAPAESTISTGGQTTILPGFGQMTVGPETLLASTGSAGGGSGSPLQREPELVLRDVYERMVSLEAGRETYGVVLVGDLDLRTLRIDDNATRDLRGTLHSGSRPVPPQPSS